MTSDGDREKFVETRGLSREYRVGPSVVHALAGIDQLGASNLLALQFGQDFQISAVAGARANVSKGSLFSLSSRSEKQTLSPTQPVTPPLV